VIRGGQAMTVLLKTKTPAGRTWTADSFKEQLYLVVRSGNEHVGDAMLERQLAGPALAKT
jgi:hypothetical protein